MQVFHISDCGANTAVTVAVPIGVLAHAVVAAPVMVIVKVLQLPARVRCTGMHT